MPGRWLTGARRWFREDAEWRPCEGCGKRLRIRPGREKARAADFLLCGGCV